MSCGRSQIRISDCAKALPLVVTGWFGKATTHACYAGSEPIQPAPKEISINGQGFATALRRVPKDQNMSRARAKALSDVIPTIPSSPHEIPRNWPNRPVARRQGQFSEFRNGCSFRFEVANPE